MSILLVYADPIFFPYAQPYGLEILSESLDRLNISSVILNPFLSAHPQQRLQQEIEEVKPQIIGFSFRNLDTAGLHFEESTSGHSYIDELKKLVDAARESTPNALLVLGGSGYSIAPEQILSYVAADIGFVGNTEKEFALFCQRYLESGDRQKARTGLPSALLPGEIAPDAPQTKLGTINSLDPVSVEYAKMVGGTIPVRTKSGCSMVCSYCVIPYIEQLNFRSWEDIRAELQLIVDAGLEQRVFIADGEFNLPDNERAIRICENIHAAFGDSIQWRCYLEAGYITEELIAAMKKAGCIGISLTVDSFSKYPRKGYIKVKPPEAAIHGTQLCLNSGIHTQLNILFGGPYETLETIMETALVARDFNEQGAALAITIGLRVYPNTPLEKNGAERPI